MTVTASEIIAALEQMGPEERQRLLPQLKQHDEKPPATRVTIYKTNGVRKRIWSVDKKDWLAAGATLTPQAKELGNPEPNEPSADNEPSAARAQGLTSDPPANRKRPRR